MFFQGLQKILEVRSAHRTGEAKNFGKSLKSFTPTALSHSHPVS